MKRVAFSLVAAALSVLAANSQDLNRGPILPLLPASPRQIVSTIPDNGDLNPYGVAFVPDDFERSGTLAPGDVLVSNFNNQAGQQGTGRTIVKITPTTGTSKPEVFFQGRDGLGLTTALAVLRAGFVLVGNIPTSDGTAATLQRGSLLVLDHSGKLVMTISDSKLNGPWDLTVNDQGPVIQIFVSNVFSGTVTRLDVLANGDLFHLIAATQIASGYQHRTDPTAVAIGPTGLAYDRAHDILYVASTGDNAIFAIANARTTIRDNGRGRIVYNDRRHLHGPLGLVLAPNGDLIASNGDAVNPGGAPNELVEFTPTGAFVAQFQLDPGPPGAAFGIALIGAGLNARFAAVNDDTNRVNVWNLH